MDKRKRARAILEQAREILVDRLIEDVVESGSDILDDAEGCSYSDEIDTLQERVGGRLNSINNMILNLPLEKLASETPPEPPATGASSDDQDSSSGTQSKPAKKPADFALFGQQILMNDIDGAAMTLSEVFDVDLELAMHCAVSFRERLNDDPTTVQKTMRLRDRLRAGENNDSLMILWDCFRLQGPQAVEVLQTLKLRL